MKEKGFSTIEMLIAMVVLTLSFSAIILISFGSQASLIDAQTNAEAINIAQGLLEKAQAYARKDFKLVVSTSADENIGGITYHESVVVVVDLLDSLIKKVTATVSWTGQANQDLSVQLNALVTDFENATPI